MSIPNLNPSTTYIDWYIAYVQPAIDLIISTGNITDLVTQISALFIGVASVYTGSDQNQHQINYVPFSSVVNGYLPVGTVSNAIYLPDPEQDVYSMQPLIDYITAFNDLSTYSYQASSTTTVPLKYLDFNVYTNYVNAYNDLINYYNLFPAAGVTKYNVLLYRYALNQTTLRNKLNSIFSKLIAPITAANFLLYYNDLIFYYPQTQAYTVGNTAYGLYALSRFVAFNARRGQRQTFIPG